MHDARHAQTIPELGCGIATTSGSGTESTSEQLTGDARAGAKTPPHCLRYAHRGGYGCSQKNKRLPLMCPAAC